VEAIEPGRLLRLRAEMKLPGLAWLELSVGQDYDGMTTYSQRAIFRPRGLAGHASRVSEFRGEGAFALAYVTAVTDVIWP
jgi:Protein of unknown function (DUF2867)